MNYCAIPTPELDLQIEAINAKIALAISKNSVAQFVIKTIVLGGGYGRGAGGVFRLKNGEIRLYNDLDLFVIINSKTSQKMNQICATFLHQLGEALSEEYHVFVEFGPLTPVKKLNLNAETLMVQELIRAYVVVWGDDADLRALKPIDFTQLPAHEMQRLLLNRGAGLLLAKQRLEKESLSFTDKDFVLRNINKALLAIGDVFLFLNHAYVFSAAERLKILEKNEAFPVSFLSLYRQAFQFKNEPPSEIGLDLKLHWQEGVLAFEWMYQYFAEHYTPCAPKKGVEKLKNFIRQFSLFRFHQIRTPFLHPREHLFSLIFFILLEKVPKTGYIYIVHNCKKNGIQGKQLDTFFIRLWHTYN